MTGITVTPRTPEVGVDRNGVDYRVFVFELRYLLLQRGEAVHSSADPE